MPTIAGDCILVGRTKQRSIDFAIFIPMKNQNLYKVIPFPDCTLCNTYTTVVGSACPLKIHVHLSCLCSPAFQLSCFLCHTPILFWYWLQRHTFSFCLIKLLELIDFESDFFCWQKTKIGNSPEKQNRIGPLRPIVLDVSARQTDSRFIKNRNKSGSSVMDADANCICGQVDTLHDKCTVPVLGLRVY